MNNEEIRTIVEYDLLSYYDSQIKEWVIKKIGNKENSSIIFSETADFPTIGNINTLYVNKNGLFIWDMDSNSYIVISGGNSEDSLKWEDF